MHGSCCIFIGARGCVPRGTAVTVRVYDTIYVTISRVLNRLSGDVHAPRRARPGGRRRAGSRRDATGRHSVATLGSRVPRTRSVTPAAGPRSARFSWFVRGVVLVNIHTPGTVASPSARPARRGHTAHGPRAALAATTQDHARRNGNTRASGSRALSVGPLAPRSRLAPTRCDADGRTGQSAGRSECASSVARSRSQRSPSRLEALYAWVPPSPRERCRKALATYLLNARPHDLKH